MDTNVAVQEACKRMHTRPSMLGRAVAWFASHISPLDTDASDNPDQWLEVFLSLDHDTQLKLLNDERERTATVKRNQWERFKPAWRK